MKCCEYDVIIKPIITELAVSKLALKKYTFKVNKFCNKIEIKKAVEKIFNVKVDKVNVLYVKGKEKRMCKNKGYRPDWKKAIVSLNKSSKSIEFFEGLS
jgi:large subunit ribosomal protein L23